MHPRMPGNRCRSLQKTQVTVQEAGRIGGLRVLRSRGRVHFAAIGRKGQQAMRRKYPGMAAEWGRKGGRPRKPTLGEIMGGRGKDTTKEVADPPALASLPQPIIQDEDLALNRSGDLLAGRGGS